MKTTITSTEKLQLLGILTLAQKHQRIIDECTQLMREILEDEDNDSLLIDAIWDGTEFEAVLKDMGVTTTDTEGKPW